VGGTDQGSGPFQGALAGVARTRGRSGAARAPPSPRDGDGGCSRAGWCTPLSSRPLAPGWKGARRQTGSSGIPRDGRLRGRGRSPPCSCSAKWVAAAGPRLRGTLTKGRRRPPRRRRRECSPRARSSVERGQAVPLRALSPRGTGGVRDPGDDRRGGDALLLPGVPGDPRPPALRGVDRLLRPAPRVDPRPSGDGPASGRRVRRGRPHLGPTGGGGPPHFRDPVRLLRLAHRAVSRGRPGVLSTRVNFATGRARVSWDPSETGIGDVVLAIRALGYTPYPPKRSPSGTPCDGKRRTCCCASGPRRSSRCR